MIFHPTTLKKEPCLLSQSTLKQIIQTLLAVVLASCAMPVLAQEILPFPPKPSGSTAGRTIQDSVYNPLPVTSRLPKESPNIIIVLIDDLQRAIQIGLRAWILTHILSANADDRLMAIRLGQSH